MVIATCVSLWYCSVVVEVGVEWSIITLDTTPPWGVQPTKVPTTPPNQLDYQHQQHPPMSMLAASEYSSAGTDAFGQIIIIAV